MTALLNFAPVPPLERETVLPPADSPVLAVPPSPAGPPAVEVVDDEDTDDGAPELIARARAGDREAFGELYREHYAFVFAFVWRRTGNQELARDLTHDAFLRALRNIGGFRWQGRPIGSWFITIARHVLMDYFKSGRYRLEVSVAEMSDSALGFDGNAARIHCAQPQQAPDEAVVDGLTGATLLALIDRLGTEQRECIMLRFFQGYSVQQTAAAMGKNEGAVKALTFRAVRSLARFFPDGREGLG